MRNPYCHSADGINGQCMLIAVHCNRFWMPSGKLRIDRIDDLTAAQGVFFGGGLT